MKPIYKRVILKISGEALAGENGTGINQSVISAVADQIIEVSKLGVEVGIVIGAGNIWRGRQEPIWTVPRRTTWECWQPL